MTNESFLFINSNYLILCIDRCIFVMFYIFKEQCRTREFSKGWRVGKHKTLYIFFDISIKLLIHKFLNLNLLSNFPSIVYMPLLLNISDQTN